MKVINCFYNTKTAVIQFVFPAILISNAVVPTSRHATLEEDARKLREIITRLNSLRVDHTEHACLKALVLFKAGKYYK